MDKIIKSIKTYGLGRVIVGTYRLLFKKYGLSENEINAINEFEYVLMGYKSEMKFNFSLGDLDKYLNNSSSKNSVLESADRICQHFTNILSDREHYLTEYIEWNKDFKTGFIWSDNDSYLLGKGKADIKRVWDLSRFYHFITLAKAYLFTKDTKYIDEIEYQYFSWKEQNKFCKSINWTSAMEVSIRTINLMAVLNLLEDLRPIRKKLFDALNFEIFRSGCFIYNNLENKGFVYNNHYLSDLVGLLYIGLYFKSSKNKIIKDKSRKWLKYSVKNLNKESLYQVNPDGVSYEKSTSYHCLVLELFLSSAIVLKKNGILPPKQLDNSIKNMYEFIKAMSVNNKIVFFGDNDDGRLFRFSDKFPNEDKHDIGFLINSTNIYLNDQEFYFDNNNYDNEDLFLTGTNLYKNNTEKNNFSTAFPSGYYILQNEIVKTIIACGGLSCNGQGGHSHNDQLSFVLYLNDILLTTDAGTFCYTEDIKKRNEFRSTQMHSTVSIVGYEQNDFNGKVFSLPEQTNSKCLEFNDSYFKGVHYGFVENCESVHSRSITLLENGIEITDELSQSSQAYSNIILDTDVKISTTGNEIFLYKNDHKYKVKHNADSFIIEPINISPSYGVLRNSNKIVFIFNGKLKFSIRIED